MPLPLPLHHCISIQAISNAERPSSHHLYSDAIDFWRERTGGVFMNSSMEASHCHQMPFNYPRAFYMAAFFLKHLRGVKLSN